MPLIARALAHLECRVAEMVVGGTHTVFLAEVEQADAGEGAPLTYFRGKFGRFETELEEAAYRELRRLVLDRELASGAALDVDELAQRLNLERQRIFYALTKLSMDGLVARDAATGTASPRSRCSPPTRPTGRPLHGRDRRRRGTVGSVTKEAWSEANTVSGVMRYPVGVARQQASPSTAS